MIEKPEEIRLAPIRLPFGSYTLICNILRDGTRHRKSFPILSARAPAARRMAEAADVSAGKLLFEKNLTSAADPAVFSEGGTHTGGGGRYLEAGSDKGDRFCFEIPFPPEQLGKPVLLDITWPDDKPRSMGFYMYGNGIWANRDRLQSGVQAGREYPESGELQTTRHLFYPGVETYEGMIVGAGGNSVSWTKIRPSTTISESTGPIDVRPGIGSGRHTTTR